VKDRVRDGAVSHADGSRAFWSSPIDELVGVLDTDVAGLSSEEAAAAAFLPFLPLLPRQILLLNFLSDIPGTTIAADAVDAEQLEAPRAWDIGSIRWFMICQRNRRAASPDQRLNAPADTRARCAGLSRCRAGRLA
jgi:hypothetical protein